MLPNKSREKRLRTLEKSPTVTFPKYEQGVAVYAAAKNYSNEQQKENIRDPSAHTRTFDVRYADGSCGLWQSAEGHADREEYLQQ